MFTLVAPSIAKAGGFEILEASPAAAGMAGAQSASVDDATATAYNPAGLATGRGFSFVGGGAAWHTDVDAASAGSTDRGDGTLGLPMVFVSDRLGPHVGIGVGAFSQFATQVAWPEGWPGATRGESISLRTTTVNLSAALRPIPQIAIGFGFAVVPGSLALRHGTPPGATDVDLSGTGLGGNVGIWIRILPRWLTLAATYRSAVDLDLEGSAAVTGMPLLQTGHLVFSLPHNVTVGLASHPIPGLTLALDIRVTLFGETPPLNLTLSDSSAPAGTPGMPDTIDLGFRDSVGVRLGAEYRFLDERVRVRAGLGFDTSPIKRGWLGPLVADASRVTVGLGLGYHHGAIGFDAGYALGILLARASTDPSFQATYSSLAHIIAVAVVVHLPDLGVRVDLPDYRH